MSVFPTVTTELYLGSALGWVDVTSAARGRPAGGGVSITRGRPAEGQDVQVARAGMRLNNAGGRFSPRNPSSPYYGLLGRNTPLRVRVAEADLGGALAVDGRRGAGSTAPGAAVTAAHTSLNGTGDLDVRVWLRMPQWQDHGGVFLAGKNDAWSLAVGDTGSLEFRWVNSSGVTTTTGSGSFKPVPAADGSLAVRVVLTVATGLRQFYTAPTIAGPWTMLSTNTFGATNIKASPTNGVEVGRVSQYGDHGVNGELYGIELRSGGTLVASPDFTTLRAGDTQLVDAQGRTWTWSGGAVPVDRGARFHGEVWSWPQRWAPGGTDQWVPIEAAGITQRLQQGNSPVESPLRRTLTRANPAAYLPLEDGSDATRPTSAAVGVGSASSSKVTYGVDPGGLGGTVSVAQMTDAGSAISTPVATRTLSPVWSTLVFFKLPTLPVGADQTYMRVFFTGGTVARWEFQLSGGGYRWVGYDKAGAVVDDRSFASTGQPPTDWLIMYVEWQQVAGTVTWDTWVANAGETLYSHGAYSYAGTVGNPTRVDMIGNSYFVNALVSHLAVDNQRLLASDDFSKVSTGYLGETAGARIGRLAAEQGIPMTFWGYPHDTVTMGPQPIAPLIDVLKDAAKADGGILVEARSHMGMHYRTGASLYNQQGLALDYGVHLSEPFEPTDDDDATRNDITVTRPGSGSARAVQESGPLSVLDPPTGVGRYATSETVNVATDDMLGDQAYWRLHLGTVDETRYPRIGFNFMREQLRGNPTVLRQIAAVDAGDVASIAGLPSWLPPGPADLMVQGYTETLDAYEWSIVWNAAPGSPWDVAVADGEPRVAADGSTLAVALPAAAASLALTSTDENGPWTEDPTDFPLPMRVGAEQVTASAISPAVSASFTTTVAGGWPTADTGQTWTTSPSGDHSSASGVGRQSNGTVNTFRTALLDTGLTDLTTTVDVTIPVMPAGNAITHWSVARAVDLSNYYTARLTVATTGAVSLALLKRTGGTLSGSLAADTLPSTHAAGNTWRVVLDVRGSTLRAKAWRPASDMVPGWQVEATDTDLTAGTLAGPLSRLESGNSNTLPVVISHDNWAVSNPQTVTLSARGVNGAAWAWPAGAPVDVWLPAVLSL